MADLIPIATPLKTGKQLINAEVAALEAKDTSLQTQITAEQQARITAINDHINAAVAHTAQQIADSVDGLSSTNVHALFVELLAKVNTIIAGSSPDKDPELTDIKNLAPGYTPYSTISSPGDVVRDIEKRLIAATWQTFAAKFGWNYLLTDQASPLEYVIKGRTLVNLPGKVGNCEDISKLVTYGTPTVTADTTNKVYGNQSAKVVTTASGHGIAVKCSVESGKSYLVVYEVKVDAGTVYASVYDNANGLDYDVQKQQSVSSGFVTLYNKFTATASSNDLRAIIRQFGSTAATCYVDGVRVYEVSSADYAAIGTSITTTTSPSISDVWPYVDGVKHLSGAGLRLTGKNLLPPFTDWTVNSNASVVEAYKLSLTAPSTTGQPTTFDASILPSKAYTFSIGSNSGIVNVRTLDANKAIISTKLSSSASAPSVTFTTEANAVYVRVEMTNATAGTFAYSSPQLELGSATTAFEPQNNDYAYVDLKLASNVDGSIRDTYDSRLGTVTRLWKTDVALDGSLAWALSGDYAGFKRLYVNSTLVSNAKASMVPYVTKHNGQPLPSGTTDTAATYGDRAWITPTPQIVISVNDSDSGWGEDYSPSAAEQDAYFNGWRMNNGTFGTPYNGTGTKTWTAINATSNTGAVTTVPTTASTAITSGAYDYYRLSYQLAAPDPQTVVPEGSLSSHNGGNQFEVLAGVIDRELATPSLGNAGDYYSINVYGNPGYTDASLSRRVSRILGIYKNGKRDSKWTIVSTYAYGNQRAYIAAADFDPTAEYTVTYQALDRYLLTTNPVDLTIYYDTNLKTVVDSMVRNLSDAETQVSIHDRILADHTARLLALEA